MDIQVINGRIGIQDARIGGRTTQSLSAYVCRPNGSIICRIMGVNSMPIRAKFVDISEIDFSVSKYIVSASTHKSYLNPCYKYLHAFACILVPELGKFGMFRINEEPVINAKNRAEESKTFTALSYESALQYTYISNFKVNMGTPDSLEMADWNLTPSGAPRERIKLKNVEDESLSLLDLIFNDNNWHEWTIMHVDASIENREASFDVNKKSVYAFLREDVQRAFRCVVEFDTVHRYINVYDVETVGRNTNIVLSLDRFLQTVNVKQSRKEIYTVFDASGGNGLSVESVNFGSNKIVNIDYPLSFLSTGLRAKYAAYKAFRESKRQDYTALYKQYAGLNAQRNSILDRQPIDETNNNWFSTVYYSLDDLRAKLADYQAMVSYIETIYSDGEGGIDYSRLDISPYAAEYYSYINVIIPDITAAIAAREPGGQTPVAVDVSTQWQLYGLNDLQVKLEAYNNMVSTLTAQGYTRPWNSTTDTISQATWNAHYSEYTTYGGYITALTSLIASRNQSLAAIEAQRTQVKASIDGVISSIDPFNWFTPNEWYYSITPLYKETSYSDGNYLITDYDTDEDIADEAEMLYQAASERLEAESRPQLSWSVTSDNLYAIQEFKKLRNSLQNGDFCMIAYGGHDRLRTVPVMETSGGETMFTTSGHMTPEPDVFYKLRVVEIDFDGMDLSSSFGIVFSDTITTTKESNDFEALIGSYISSATSAVKSDVIGTSANNAYDIARKIVEPYISAIQMQLEKLKTQTVTVGDFNVVKITADQIRGGTMTLGGINDIDGVLVVNDAGGNRVGEWTKDGITAKRGVIGGWLISGNDITVGEYIEDSDGEIVSDFIGLIAKDTDEPWRKPYIISADATYTATIGGGELKLYDKQDATEKRSVALNPRYLNMQRNSFVGDSMTDRYSVGLDSSGITINHQVPVTGGNLSLVNGSEITDGNVLFRDPNNPQLASGIVHWSVLSARRQVKDTLYVTVYHCGNLFWAHFDGTIAAGWTSENARDTYLPIIASDTGLTESLYCVPPAKVVRYIQPYTATNMRLSLAVNTDGTLGISRVFAPIVGSATTTTADYIDSCDIFWAHLS